MAAGFVRSQAIGKGVAEYVGIDPFRIRPEFRQHYRIAILPLALPEKLPPLTDFQPLWVVT